MTEPIRLTIDDGLARITLNRPTRLNAFNAELAHGFAAATARATSRDDVGAILIDAEGPAFCAGGDVMEMATTMSSGADLEALAIVINTGLTTLTEAAIPVAAAAHGTTAGGGLGLLLACDYVVVGANSKIGSRYAAIGLTPDLSVTAQLARAVGERRALQLVLSDRLLTGAEALEWGLAAEVVGPVDADSPDASVLAKAVRARAEEVARSWLAGASGAYGQAKRLIRSQPSRSFAAQLAEEARTIAEAFDTEEARTRVAAFARASEHKTRREPTQEGPR